MAQEQLGWTLSELAEIVGGEIFGPNELLITHPVPAGSNDPNGITFAESKKYLVSVEKTSVGAVLIADDEQKCSKPHIRCRSPREAFGRILALAWKELPIEEGIHPTAVVSPSAQIEMGAFVGAYSVIESGAYISKDAKIYPFCYIGENCRIGIGAKVYPHATLYRDVLIGERTIIHSNSVVGADGFGFFWDGVRHRKVPQVGKVQIGDDCEIGALTAIDRATEGETIIGSGTKIDNLVQIAHNVNIGSDTVIAAQSGISGSSNIGSRVVMGGGVGVRDHTNVGDDVMLGGRTGVAKDILKPGAYWGSPALEAREATRVYHLLTRLPELLERIKKLEDEIATLRIEHADTI